MWLSGVAVLLLVLSRRVASVTECPQTSLLAGQCVCGLRPYERATRYVVNCTGTGFRSADVLATLPTQTEVLVFTGNNVPELPWNVFGDNELTDLSVVDMSDNRIREISGKAYHRAPNVVRLVLDHNDLAASALYLRPRLLSGFAALRELHLTDAFADRSSDVPKALHAMFLASGLIHLQKLHLEQNELRTMGDERVLCMLPALLDLHLADNELEAVPPLDWRCTPLLRYLDLRRNRISRLSHIDLGRLDSLASVRPLALDLAANPLECEYAAELLAWSQHSNVTLRGAESLRCRRRYDNGTIAVLSLVDGAVTDDSIGPTIPLVLVTLSSLTVLAVAIFVYRFRHRRTRFLSLAGIVSGSVSYTTIEPQDV